MVAVGDWIRTLPRPQRHRIAENQICFAFGLIRIPTVQNNSLNFRITTTTDGQGIGVEWPQKCARL